VLDIPKTDGIVKIHRETKGRKGNGVSIIVGLAMDEENLKTLAKQLKQKLGIGGSVKHGHIELQTGQREQIKDYLQSQGYQVKIAGG
jgi:translation initiation factor 1